MHGGIMYGGDIPGTADGGDFGRLVYDEFKDCRTIGVLAFLGLALALISIFFDWIEIEERVASGSWVQTYYYYWNIGEIGAADGYLGTVAGFRDESMGSLQGLAWAIAALTVLTFILGAAAGLTEAIRTPYRRMGSRADIAEEAGKYFLWSGIVMLGFCIITLGLLAAFVGDELFQYYYSVSSGTDLYPTAGTGPIMIGLGMTASAVLFSVMVLVSMKHAKAAAQMAYSAYAAPQYPPWQTVGPDDAPQSGPAACSGTGSIAKYCPNCGTQVSPGSLFCPNCGRKL